MRLLTTRTVAGADGRRRARLVGVRMREGNISRHISRIRAALGKTWIFWAPPLPADTEFLNVRARPSVDLHLPAKLVFFCEQFRNARINYEVQKMKLYM